MTLSRNADLNRNSGANAAVSNGFTKYCSKLSYQGGAISFPFVPLMTWRLAWVDLTAGSAVWQMPKQSTDSYHSFSPVKSLRTQNWLYSCHYQ